MEKKILVGIIALGMVLVLAISVMIFILLTREAIEPEVEEAIVEEVLVEEPPPLEEEALRDATLLVAERLRVFDVEERQDRILDTIESSMPEDANRETKLATIQTVVDSEMTAWKEQVIRDTLLELYGAYSSEDYFAIDQKTDISKLRNFIVQFEMEILGIK
ncbi:MAG: hypothetical protein JXO44_04320 [Clostridia bacterium]|nr:hypothetical protein [Clostridia bacterium]